MQSPLVLLLVAFPTVLSLTCTVCEFRLLPPHTTSCNETCEGDVCFIVVNKFFNGTINAGCMHLHEGDTFENEAICQRGAHDNRCACTTGDRCNDPKVKISSYTFTESPVLAGYQWLPQIQPPMPELQPVLPPESIPTPSENEINTNINDTMTEMETGVEADLAHFFENNGTLRNEEGENEENLMTVKTTVGLNVRDHTNREVIPTTTAKSFTTGQGSVQVTKVAQEPETPRVETTRSRPNITSDGAEEDPNSAGTTQFLLMTTLSVLIHRLL